MMPPCATYIAQVMEGLHVGAQGVQGFETDLQVGLQCVYVLFFLIHRVLPSFDMRYEGIPPLELSRTFWCLGGVLGPWGPS